MAQPPPQQPLRTLPPPFNTSAESFELIAQGAESLLYRTTFLSPAQPAALKVRPQKTWRHPTLDKRLTRQRVLAEARVLVKLSGEGIVAGGGGRKVKDPKKKNDGGGDNGGVGALRGLVPAVLALDWERGWLVTEWIDGVTVKLGIYQRDLAADEGVLRGLLGRIGRVVGLLHLAGVVHGDLTTSNMMLRPTRTPGTNADAMARAEEERGEVEVEGGLEGDIVLIDFGLATQSVSDEDRAVDLYVLERAFGSTHPKEEGQFDEVLKAYGESMGKPGKVVLRRLEDVRMRGRKKSMLG
ncbi:hypothetical protein LTR36_001548 [Oleoguttula mirabilis]|uniref:EKC/KEOPS complex subunit BUD32 n=1 Tax=Oleoguttula mirabilis TaxID=1507867 RepID=A0AAV9JP86_9PEZI|nr:hypothetical protein LTR36_001548 [Oleoguttula mirabilis]